MQGLVVFLGTTYCFLFGMIAPAVDLIAEVVAGIGGRDIEREFKEMDSGKMFKINKMVIGPLLIRFVAFGFILSELKAFYKMVRKQHRMV